MSGWPDAITYAAAREQRPGEFTILDELPRTSVGKIHKFLLREEVSAP